MLPDVKPYRKTHGHSAFKFRGGNASKASGRKEKEGETGMKKIYETVAAHSGIHINLRRIIRMRVIQGEKE